MSDDPLSTRVGEQETLTGFLDWYRAVAANKVRGLSDGDARRAIEPSGLSLLGVVARRARRPREPAGGIVSLRWILVHMIEETARHAGHLDIMRA